MNLQEEKRQVSELKSVSKRLICLIDSYLDFFKQAKESYNLAIVFLKDDFIARFKDEDFTLRNYSKGGDYYVDDEFIKADWENGALVFELSVYREMDRESNLNVFLKVDSQNRDSLYSINVNPNEYKIDIHIDNSRYIKGRSGLEEIRNKVAASKYTIEEIECLYKVIEEDKNKLIDNIKLLKNYSFVCSSKDINFEFNTINELIENI